VATSDELFEVSAMFKMFIKGISNEWNKRGYNLNITQYKILHLLEKDGPMNVTELAHATSITSSAVTGVTDQLLTEAYVEKERSSKDRRVVHITITAKGKLAIEEIQKDQKEIMHMHFNKLSEEDIQHLKRIFTILNSGISY
jgi:MarR family transcriptional regulator, organic hydroperoxide resistance regulator